MSLSNLYDKTFTIINQIPTSQTVATKIAWVKHTISGCEVVSGIYDKSEKTLYTANVGDLVIFREIEDPAPTTLKEFNDLRTKYANEGGILTTVEAFINYHNDRTPWRTNHIELIRG